MDANTIPLPTPADTHGDWHRYQIGPTGIAVYPDTNNRYRFVIEIDDNETRDAQTTTQVEDTLRAYVELAAIGDAMDAEKEG